MVDKMLEPRREKSKSCRTPFMRRLLVPTHSQIRLALLWLWPGASAVARLKCTKHDQRRPRLCSLESPSFVYTKGAHSSLATHGGHAPALPVQRPGPSASCMQWLDLVLFCEARVTLPSRCVVHVESDSYSPLLSSRRYIRDMRRHYRIPS